MEIVTAFVVAAVFAVGIVLGIIIDRRMFGVRQYLPDSSGYNDTALEMIRMELDKLNDAVVSKDSRIEAHVGLLAQATQAAREETTKLAGALSNSSTRGSWGEVTLRRAVEAAGMLPYCDFEEQVSRETDSNKVRRPDMVIRLPENRLIVVDSKAPLHYYLQGVKATTKEEKRAALESHVRSIREHVNGLASKQYWSLFDTSPEFVVMFLPQESLLSAAWETDPGLFDYAISKKVIITTGTTLIGLLLAIHHSWKQDNMAKNVEQIKSIGLEMYERLSVVNNNLSQLGQSIRGVVNAYNSTLYNYNSRLGVSGKRLAGALGTRELSGPEELTDEVRT